MGAHVTPGGAIAITLFSFAVVVYVLLVISAKA